MVYIHYFICSNCYHYYQSNYLGLLLGWIKGRSKGGTKPSSRYLSIFLFIYLYLSFYLLSISIYLSIYLSYLSIYFYLYLTAMVGDDVNIIKTTFDFTFDLYQAFKEHGYTKTWKQSEAVY